MGYIPSRNSFGGDKEESFLPPHHSCSAKSANSSLPPRGGNCKLEEIISGQSTEMRCFEYNKGNRTCLLQILEQSFDGCVQQVCVKYFDDVQDDTAQAEIVIAVDGIGEALYYEMNCFSNNLALWKCTKNEGWKVEEDNYVGCYRPQGHSVFGCTSRRVVLPPLDRHVAIVEHYYYNKEADEYRHVRVVVELQKHMQRGLLTKVSGPLTTKQITGPPAALHSAILRSQLGDPVNEKPCTCGGASVGEPNPHLPSYINSGQQKMIGLVNSSGSTLGLGNNSIFFNNCNFNYINASK